MKRRVLLGSVLALAGCGLSERPFPDKRAWPLVVSRPAALPPRRRGRILLVRNIRAAPGLEARGIQWLETDGSLHVDFYEEWAVPPAESVESDLRQWLAASGLFAAVTAPGSRLTADLVLEGALTTFLADRKTNTARAAMTVVLLAQRPTAVRILMQRRFVSERPLPSPDAPGVVEALRACLADLLGQIEAAVAAKI